MSLHLPCAECSAVNRIPDDRLGDQPKCGQCAAPLLPGKPINLSSKNFRALTSKSDLPVVVDFWAPWCGPCKMMAPAFEAAAGELNTQAIFAKLNTEDEPTLGSQYNIRSIPTVVIFKHGHELARQSGAMDNVNLQRFIGPYVTH